MILIDLEWVSEIFSDTKHQAVSLRQLSFLFYKPGIRRPVRGGGPRRNIAITFDMEKLEWCHFVHLHVATQWWKKIDDICLAVSTEYRRVTGRQTDGWTNRSTDRHISTPQSALCIASGGNKLLLWLLSSVLYPSVKDLIPFVTLGTSVH